MVRSAGLVAFVVAFAGALAAAGADSRTGHRAALLIEAPDHQKQMRTFVGSVVWKVYGSTARPNDRIVEADIDIPENEMKVAVVFRKDVEASSAASYTIKVRFTVEPRSPSGNVKKIGEPTMRSESSPIGEPLGGLTTETLPNTFLVSLSPGKARANIDLLRRLQWLDVPMLLDSGKIAKLTFEKGESGRRHIDEMFEAGPK